MTGPSPDLGRVLVKLRNPDVIKMAADSANLRPLYPEPRSGGALGVASGPRWYVADLSEPVEKAWDLAHGQVSSRLGVDARDVLFAEPDITHSAYVDAGEDEQQGPFAAGESCESDPQDDGHGKAVGPEGRFAWHLDNDYTGLRAARDSVTFNDPRTRIAHIDTGYYRDHETVPEQLLGRLGRSFVDDGRDSRDAEDPDNWVFLLDNSGHGTGTIGILAGGRVSSVGGEYLGGAPQAEVLPLRVADRVVLLRTSALAQAFDYAVDQRCDVVTLSMGGLPSRVWSEAVDRAYENGVLICAAAGNHVAFTPPHTVVFPARYDRVLAVCGVMADGRPYADLEGAVIEGSFGPASAMDRALAAYTPNIPWPKFGCRTGLRLKGEGTSAATPQVAAAAALWIERYKKQLPQGWRRVEAVRHALFSTAKKLDREHFGNGILQAAAALEASPRLGQPDSEIAPAAIGQNSFAFLRLITGLGLEAPTPQEEMYNLELAQRWLLSSRLQQAVPDLERASGLTDRRLRQVLEAVIEDDGASHALRKHLAARYPVITGRPFKPTELSAAVVPKVVRSFDAVPEVARPPYRRLRVYATDPSLSSRLESVDVNEATLFVRWEELRRPDTSTPSGKVAAGRDGEAAVPTPAELGEYFAVDDIDPPDDDYGLVDLNEPRLIATDGWAPSEGNPHFHQQMVYAVALKTVEHFEQALGRPVLWRPDPNAAGSARFRQRLTLRPHALRQANAYYSPEEVALLFGYFDAAADDRSDHWPGTRVYSCLSYDIIAHETTHAILDGMYRRFSEPTNPDVLALHEAFADIVALLQHFTLPELLEHQIISTRGDLEAESILGSLAVQFGRASGRGGALRDAIGRIVDGRWQRNLPDPTVYDTLAEPHARGALLVAAVFDALLAIYKLRTADLIRLATAGTGVLPSGAVHPDLVHRLADEATKSAKHVLHMAIRALDYLPPVDVTFFEYLRALITADFDLVRDDRYNYRVALVEAFRRRGIHPENLPGAIPGDPPRTLSVETLRWQGLDQAQFSNAAWKQIRRRYEEICDELRAYADRAVYHLRDRKALFIVTDEYRDRLKTMIKKAFKEAPAFATQLGVVPNQEFEIEELRRVTRVSPDGRQTPQVIVSLTQTEQDKEQDKEEQSLNFRGGSTMIVDLIKNEVVYTIRKRIDNPQRRDRAEQFVRHIQSDPLRAAFLGADRSEPFAALHALAER